MVDDEGHGPPTFTFVSTTQRALSLIRHGSPVFAIPLSRRQQYGLSLLLARQNRDKSALGIELSGRGPHPGRTRLRRRRWS